MVKVTVNSFKDCLGTFSLLWWLVIIIRKDKTSYKPMGFQWCGTTIKCTEAQIWNVMDESRM